MVVIVVVEVVILMFEFDNIDPISTLNWSRLYPLVVTWGVSCQFHSVVVLALKCKINIKIRKKNDLMATLVSKCG